MTYVQRKCSDDDDATPSRSYKCRNSSGIGRAMNYVDRQFI
jgi:hypothetical protein